MDGGRWAGRRTLRRDPYPTWGAMTHSRPPAPHWLILCSAHTTASSTCVENWRKTRCKSNWKITAVCSESVAMAPRHVAEQIAGQAAVERRSAAHAIMDKGRWSEVRRGSTAKGAVHSKARYRHLLAWMIHITGGNWPPANKWKYYLLKPSFDIY